MQIKMMEKTCKLVCSLYILFIEMEMVLAQNKTTPVDIGVILDFDDEWVGKIGLSCINVSLSDFYANHPHYNTRLVLNTRDSKADVVNSAAAAVDLIKNVEVQAILGPSTSMQANFVIQLGEKAQVPIISFSASSPFLTSIPSSYFFQVTENDKTQVTAISAIVKAFGWREAVPIYVDNEYGAGVIPCLMEALQAIDTRVPYKSVISPSASDVQIQEELYKLMTLQTRVFIVHMFPTLGSLLFTKAKEIGMMGEGYVWIMTDGMTNFLSSVDPSVIDSMQGALGVKPYVPNTKELENFRVRWKRKFHRDHPEIVDAELNIYGLWAYDATMALAMATEKVGIKSLGFQRANWSCYPMDLETLGASRNGPKLAQALSKTSFKGLTGNFRFENQQLQSLAFQILNVNGVKPREIGFWTPVEGLVKKLNSTTNASSTSKSSLGTIIWPGDSTFVPKGWEIPTNGKKLRIGVPIRPGFTEFVKVMRDNNTNTTKFTGYCIDVFDSVVKELPYAVTYEYIPLNSSARRKILTYNDLVYQVYVRNIDALVGDITILANRSLYVDFTLPFLDSDVLMLVQVTGDKNSNAMIFMKPLSRNLWVTTFCFFLFIGFVIWVLEHRVNEDFRGPPSYQAGTSLWFAFSTMVFAHRERVINNLARIVVVIWSFVLLILTQSYTASLASFLTVQQLHPAVTDVSELIQKREYVGYMNNSFVLGILKGLGFQDSQMRPYNSAEECDQLLLRGIENGGIVAAFDESPYMKLIQARNCSKYAIVEPSIFMSKIPGRNVKQFKTGGFGFVFPRGSPLVADMSRAILKVSENDRMKRIEDAWISEASRCPVQSNSVTSGVLGLDSFWGLFLIAGVVSVSSLVTYAVMFIYAQREVLKLSNSEASKWRRFLHLLRIFNQRDPKSFGIIENQLNGRNCILVQGMDAPNALDDAAVQADYPRELGSSSAEHINPNPNNQTAERHGHRH